MFPGIDKSKGSSRNLFASASMSGFPSEEEKKNLDAVFFRPQARSSYGRRTQLGVVRTEQPKDDKDMPCDISTDSNGDPVNPNSIAKSVATNGGKSISSYQGIRSKISGQILVDMRTLPKISSVTLTVKHPGMNSFNNSLSMNGQYGGNDNASL